MLHPKWKKRLGVASLVVMNLGLAAAIQLSWGRPAAVGAAVPPKALPAASEEERVIRAIAKANPAVVSIVVRQRVEDPQAIVIDGSGDVTLPPPDARLEEVGRGTGFLVSADGMIVTNRHVAGDRSSRYDVLLSDERSFPARILDVDPVNDLALLKIDAEKLPVAALETDDRLRVGQTVIAIGNALGKYSNTVTRGILSGVNRSLEASDEFNGGTEVLEDVLQTDAAINQGNSGGPLLNLEGRVIGVNVAIDRGGEGLGFAIPVSEVRKVLASYARYGAIARPRLGLRYLMITPELRLERKLDRDRGALIDAEEGEQAVLPNSPAAAAGLRAGDVILEVNGKAVEGRATLGRLIQSMDVGDNVTLKVVRNGVELNLRVTLDAHPPVTD